MNYIEFIFFEGAVTGGALPANYLPLRQQSMTMSPLFFKRRNPEGSYAGALYNSAVSACGRF
jgi:hypothetical protein